MMSLYLLIYILVFIYLIFLNKKMHNNIYDSFLFVMGPYVVITFLNNILFSKIGFIKVSDKVIFIYIVSMFVFFVGKSLGDYLSKRFVLSVKGKRIIEREITVNISLVRKLMITCLAVIFFDFVYRIRAYGMLNISSGIEEYGTFTIASHMLITIVPFSVILIENWLNTKNKIDIILVLVGSFLIMMTFTKYHIISLFLIVFVYQIMKNPKFFYKMVIPILVLIIAAFVLNYIINFYINGVNVNSSFFLYHFWAYVSGGVINLDKGIYHFNGSTELSIYKWLCSMIMATPGMFLNKLGLPVYDYSFEMLIPNFSLGISSSNVISIMGSAYIQSNMITYIIFVFLWGFITEYMYKESIKANNLVYKLVAATFLGFNILSFFGCFFVLNGPWEQMIQIIIIFAFIKKRMNNSVAK